MKAIIFFFILDIIVSKFSFFSVVKISVGASNAIIPTYTAYHYPGMFFFYSTDVNIYILLFC